MSENVIPESSDPLVKQLSVLLQKTLDAQEMKFMIQEDELNNEEIAAHDGLMCLFMFKASEISEEMMGKKLPLFFEREADALFGYVPMTEESDLNLISLWSHCLHYSVEAEIKKLKNEKKMKNNCLQLDGLYQEWVKALTEKKYLLRNKPNSVQKQ